MDVTIPANYEPRSYQLPFLRAMDNGSLRACLVWHRRSGKTVTLLNFAIKSAFTRVGTYYHCFPEYGQGRKIVWDGIDLRAQRRLLEVHIPKELRAKENQAEMKVRLPNGSVYQIIGADNYDAVMGSNPVGIILDEWALSDRYRAAWDYFRPILVENGGWAVFNFCVSPDTIIVTENGPARMSSISEGRRVGFSDIDLKVFGIGGLHSADSFFKNGEGPALKITTSFGYSLICTKNHPVWDGFKWIKSEDLSVGAQVAIQRGMQCWGNAELLYSSICSHKNSERFVVNERMAYLLGLWLAEGNINGDSNVVITTRYDRDLDDTLVRYGFKRYDDVHYIKSSKRFVQFIDWLGFERGAKNKRIPDKILSLPKKLLSIFLRGYFDGDGCATKKGAIHCDSASEGLIDDIQALLLNFGIISSKRGYTVQPTKKVKVQSTGFRLEIQGYGAVLFYDQIGFKLQRKNSRKKTISKMVRGGYGDLVKWPSGFDKDKYVIGLNMTDLKRHDVFSYRTLKKMLAKKPDDVLQKIYDDHFFYDAIVSIEPCKAHTCDFVIPETHSFFSNGFISHNTPRGRNHGWDIYQMALGNPKWFCQLLTVDDTRVVSQADIQAERESGMSDAMIRQEFYCDFIADVDDVLIPFSFIQKALKDQTQYLRSGRVAGYDPARLGGDRNGFVIRQAGQVIHIESWTGQDAVYSAGRIIQHYRNKMFDLVAVDTVGLGGPIYDYLKSAGVPCVGVNVAESSTVGDSRFVRLRDEIWWRLREWFQEGASISSGVPRPDIDALVKDIQDIRYGYSPKGQVKVESKDEFRDRAKKNGDPRSPDLGDALCCTLAPAAEMRIRGEDSRPFEHIRGVFDSAGPVYSPLGGYEPGYNPLVW